MPVRSLRVDVPDHLVKPGDTASEAVQRAVDLYSMLKQEQDNGGDVCVRDRSGQNTIVTLD